MKPANQNQMALQMPDQQATDLMREALRRSGLQLDFAAALQVKPIARCLQMHAKVLAKKLRPA